MSISAVNSVQINDNTAFKTNDSDKFKEFREYTYKLKDTSVKKIEDMKEPIVVAGQVTAMSALAYLSVQCVIAGALPRFAPNLSSSLEKTLRNSANAVKTKAADWKSIQPDGIISKFKNKSGAIIGKIESFTRSLYKGIAYRGLPDTMVNPERSNNALGNIGGTGAFIYTIYNACTKDEDGDGIKDIFQHKHSVLSAILPSDK